MAYKHAEVAKAWLEGKHIQVKSVAGDKWLDLEQSYTSHSMPTFHVSNEYRLKPEPVVVKYKRFLWKKYGDYRIECASPRSNLRSYETSELFGGWIDAEWQEYVVND